VGKTSIGNGQFVCARLDSNLIVMNMDPMV